MFGFPPVESFSVKRNLKKNFLIRKMLISMLKGMLMKTIIYTSASSHDGLQKPNLSFYLKHLKT